MSLRIFSSRSLGGGDGCDTRKAGAEALARGPEIEGLLHAQKKLRAPADELGEAQSHVGRDSGAAAQHRMQGLAADAHPAGCFRHRQLDMLLDDLAHQFTGMAWRTCPSAKR